MIKQLLTGVLALAACLPGKAVYPVNYEVEALGTLTNSTFAPYYMASNRHGILTQGNNALLLARAWKPMETDRRFSYSFGVQLAGGAQSATDYLRYYPVPNVYEGYFAYHKVRPNGFWVQQLYAEVKYRSLYLSAGQKDRESALLNYKLSSGDVIESGNARSVPQVRVGFIDFQDIPLTKHALQIQGEVAYGAYTQDNWIKSHFNNYQGNFNLRTLYHYKRMYFRTKPSAPFSATFGGQVCTMFGGDTYTFINGIVTETKNRTGFQAYWQAFLPRDNGREMYVEGQHIGTWDIMLRYRFRNGAKLKAYLQNLWEDGSGMGKLNGFDGLWGLEYQAAKEGWLTGAVVEYVDFRNQGGPMHWDPHDNPNTSLNQSQATGNDSYYNNIFYNSYANYGMSMGTPFMKSPIYYQNGLLMFEDNRIHGVHIGISGNPIQNLEYRVLWSWRKSLGTYLYPRLEKAKCNSFMAQADYRFKGVKGLRIGAQIAFDRGELYGNNVGGCITLGYSGILNFKK